MVQKGQKDPRSLLGNATGRDEPGNREGLSNRCGKGDDAASPRLLMAAPQHGLEGQAGMSGVVLVASSLAVLSLLAFAVSLVALCELGQRAGTGTRPEPQRAATLAAKFRRFEAR